MTLRELDFLVTRRADVISRTVDFPTARILHAICNLWGRKADDPEIPLEKFLIEREPEAIDPNELKRRGLEQMKALVTLLGGEVNL